MVVDVVRLVAVFTECLRSGGAVTPVGGSCPPVLTVSPIHPVVLTPGRSGGFSGAAVLQVACANNPSSGFQHGKGELVWFLSSVQYRKQGISRAPGRAACVPPALQGMDRVP